MSVQKSEVALLADRYIQKGWIPSEDASILPGVIALLEETYGPIKLSRPMPAQGEKWTKEAMEEFRKWKDLRDYLADSTALLNSQQYGPLLRFVMERQTHAAMGMTDEVVLREMRNQTPLLMALWQRAKQRLGLG